VKRILGDDQTNGKGGRSVGLYGQAPIACSFFRHLQFRRRKNGEQDGTLSIKTTRVRSNGGAEFDEEGTSMP